MKVYISLTTISSRMNILQYVVQSLVNQKYKADKIFINLSVDSFGLDEGVKKIPTWASKYEKENIEFLFVENIGPYRKLNPILEKINNDDLLVTCDDDVLYDEEWLGSLIECSEKYKNCIICSQARRIRKNLFGTDCSYLYWNIENTSEFASLELLPIGAGGVVYRKELIDVNFILNNQFKVIAPFQDDLWYKMGSILKGTKVVVCNKAKKSFSSINLDSGLYLQNLRVTGSAFGNIIFTKIVNIYYYFLGYFGYKATENDKAWIQIKKFVKYID